MIELNFKRNKRGMYIVDDNNIHMYDVQHCINEVSSEPYESNVWLVKGDTKVLAKGPFIGNYEPKTYLMLTYGELLFSEFAKQNNIPCADIDVGLYNGEKPMTFSKNVLSSDSETIFMTDLERLSGNNYVISIFTIYQIEKAMQVLCETQGINLEKDFRKKLIKMTMADFLASQVDRNFTNINYEIIFKKDGSEIRVVPMFDNEGVFGFCDLSTEYLENPGLFESVLDGYLANEPENIELIEKIKKLTKENFVPQLGIYTTTEPDFWHEYGVDGLVNRLNDDNASELAREVFVKELAEEILNDEELEKFYNSLKFDAVKCGKKINNETGFTIPSCFLNLAQELYDYRKHELDMVLQSMKNKEPGEEE